MLTGCGENRVGEKPLPCCCKSCCYFVLLYAVAAAFLAVSLGVSAARNGTIPRSFRDDACGCLRCLDSTRETVCDA